MCVPSLVIYFFAWLRHLQNGPTQFIIITSEKLKNSTKDTGFLNKCKMCNQVLHENLYKLTKIHFQSMYVKKILGAHNPSHFSNTICRFYNHTTSTPPSNFFRTEKRRFINNTSSLSEPDYRNGTVTLITTWRTVSNFVYWSGIFIVFVSLN